MKLNTGQEVGILGKMTTVSLQTIPSPTVWSVLPLFFRVF
jgi:hypothetical protein